MHAILLLIEARAKLPKQRGVHHYFACLPCHMNLHFGARFNGLTPSFPRGEPKLYHVEATRGAVARSPHWLLLSPLRGSIGYRGKSLALNHR